MAHYPAITRGVIDESTQQRHGRRFSGVMADHSAKSVRVQKRNVGTQHHHRVHRGAELGECDLDRPAGARGVVLPHTHRIGRDFGNDVFNLLCLVLGDHHEGFRAQRFRRCQYVANERDTRERVENLGDSGFHPSALPSGQNHDGQRRRAHTSI